MVKDDSQAVDSAPETPATDSPTTEPPTPSSSSDIKILGVALIALVGIGAVYYLAQQPGPGKDQDAAATENTKSGPSDTGEVDPPAPDVPADPVAARRERLVKDPRFVNFGPVVFWWDAIPKEVREASIRSGPSSNMHREDYAGPEACAECHKEQHQDWLQHSHRRMNAKADEQNVEGDFSDATLQYLKGTATFYRDGAAYRMKLQRDETELVYDIQQTIGSRFFQYYIGRLVEGPFAEGHPYREFNHVLPFGYWLAKREWVPVVHVGPEKPDGQRDDPFAPRKDPQQGESFLPYASNCSMCHTTFPLADDLTRKPREIGKHAPMLMHWNMSEYFRDRHPELWGDVEHPADVPAEGIHALPEKLMAYEAEKHAVTLGVSCEACHLGSKEHAKNPKIKPDFHPHSPHLLLQTPSGELKTGRAHQNLNWACGRCHVGGRPMFAAGMSTWNSVEYSDAVQGSCYSELKCIDCHPPHQGIGAKWKQSPQQDDARCMKCHTKFKADNVLVDHTHHDAGSAGSRCMNCHMPRINEGLQDVVRTHMIYSPTNAAMMEGNHPNACNLCHTSENIDWTLEHLEKWYGAKFDEEKIAAAYPSRKEAVARGWLKSDYEPVRLVGADAISRADDKLLLPDLINMLDDPYLLNRQFSQLRVETMLKIDLKDFGYKFYMSPDERKEPLAKIREAVSATK